MQIFSSNPAAMAVIVQQQMRREPPTPNISLFCLNDLPHQSSAKYVWMDNENWDDNLYWID